MQRDPSSRKSKHIKAYSSSGFQFEPKRLVSGVSCVLKLIKTICIQVKWTDSLKDACPMVRHASTGHYNFGLFWWSKMAFAEAAPSIGLHPGRRFDSHRIPEVKLWISVGSF